MLVGANLKQHLQAVAAREIRAIHLLKPAKQITLFCGPHLYQPDAEKKLEALSQYRKIIDALIPQAPNIAQPYLWHKDLHGENIYVDPDDPGKLTGIIDWQSCHVSPLFNHNPDPAFLNWDGLEPGILEPAPSAKLSGISHEDRSAAVREYADQNVFIKWRKLMHAENPALYQAVKYRKTAAYELMHLSNRMYEYGEAHFQSLLVDLKDTWRDLPTVASDTPFPFTFSDEDIERTQRNADDAVAGADLATAARKNLGVLWPGKGFVEHERYDECKAALDNVKDLILEQLAETDKEREEYERHWPFD